MPFTLAHPALVLPLGKSKFRLSLTALIAGSMVPDFEFFFQMKEVPNIGHHWYGILLFDLPVAWIFCYLFHGLLKQELVANLPAYYRNRFAATLPFNWIAFAAANKIRVFVSILVGLLTHLFWDGFTHADGIFVGLWPALSVNYSLGNYQLPLYYLLQLVFSAGGMLLVHHSISRLPVAAEAAGLLARNKYFWPLLVLFFTLILGIRILGWPQYNSFWSIVMACMGGISYAWLLSTVFITRFITQKKKS